MEKQRGKILITDDLHPLLIKGLEEDGYEVHNRPDISPEEVMTIIGAYEGLVINSKIYAGAELLGKAEKLKFVCRAGSGLEVIDREFAHKRGIAAFNSPEGNRNAVAEQALGMLLALMNHICKADREVKEGVWKREENRGVELSGKTVGLFAFGNTAQAFAKLLSGFDVTVLAYDKYLREFGVQGVKKSSMREIAVKADVLSIHLPLTPETYHLIDYDYLSSFAKPYWLINTSRGKVLHTVDLLRAINEGKIRGAALDVLENEKLETLNTVEKRTFRELAANDNVILTPHIAGWTVESKLKIAQVLLQKIRNLTDSAECGAK